MIPSPSAIKPVIVYLVFIAIGSQNHFVQWL
jgi:hypothetical protein